MKNKDLYISQMSLETSHELVRDVRKMNNGCECAYCVAGLAYFTEKDRNVYRVMKESMNYKCVMVDSLEALDEPCIKMTVYHPEDAEGATADYFTPKWKDRLQVSCSGIIYMDVMNMGTNKGVSLKKVQEYLGITKDETMVFGDNSNDLEMFQAVDNGIAMGNGSDDLKAIARDVCGKVSEDGIYHYCLERGLI